MPDRLKVGHIPLEDGILVRIQVRQPRTIRCMASREVKTEWKCRDAPYGASPYGTSPRSYEILFCICPK